jgi:hypothetical protein
MLEKLIHNLPDFKIYSNYIDKTHYGGGWHGLGGRGTTAWEEAAGVATKAATRHGTRRSTWHRR